IAEPSERLVMSHAVTDRNGELVGVMIVARNLEYLTQVQSTIRYSRKLAALGRLSAVVAHEVKNPLNAMMIHLELLRQQFTDRRGVTVAIECERVPDVNADPAMLRQAFLNLALNAVQAMPHGGTLRVVCAAASGRRVSVSFVDTGIGIAPEHLQRIFDLYFTT